MNFTPHPLPDVSLFLLDKTAEMIQSFAVVAVCAHARDCAKAEEGSVAVGYCALWHHSSLPCVFSESLKTGTFLFLPLPA